MAHKSEFSKMLGFQIIFMRRPATPEKNSTY